MPGTRTSRPKGAEVLNAEAAAALLGAHVEPLRRLARKGNSLSLLHPAAPFAPLTLSKPVSLLQFEQTLRVVTPDRASR